MKADLFLLAFWLRHQDFRTAVPALAEQSLRSRRNPAGMSPFHPELTFQRRNQASQFITVAAMRLRPG
jgi:hypothetical protein